MGVFLDQSRLFFGHPFGFVFFWKPSIHFHSQSVMDRSEFLNQYPCMPSRPGIFQFGTFLSVALSESLCIFDFGSSLSPSNSFPMLLVHSDFLLYSLHSQYFTLKLFCFLVIQLLVCFHAFSSHLLVEFFSLFWNILFYLHCFILSQYHFSLPSFASTSWFISSSCIVCFTCVAFFFSSQHVPVSGILRDVSKV